MLLQVFTERKFGFKFKKFAGQHFAVLIHTFNIHILHYRHRTCLFGRRPPFLSSRVYTGWKFYRVLNHYMRAATNVSKWRMGFNSAFKGLSKAGVKGCWGLCQFSTQQSCPAQTYDKWDNPYNSYSVALVRERTIPTERPPPVGEVSANFCG